MKNVDKKTDDPTRDDEHVSGYYRGQSERGAKVTTETTQGDAK